MRPPISALPIVLLLSGTGCSPEYENPFAGRTRTVVPPASASLLFTTSQWAPEPGSGREVFSVDPDGANLTRLTYCNTETSTCDNLDAAPSPDRLKILARRVLGKDTAPTVVYVDLARRVETSLVMNTSRVSGLEWTPYGDRVYYSGLGVNGTEDIFRMDYNGQNTVNLSGTPAISERGPRFDQYGLLLTFGVTDASGLGVIYGTDLSGGAAAITTGGTPGPAIPGTPWVVGSDANPARAPNGGAVVFRRCTGLGPDGRGTWDILTVKSPLVTPTVVTQGPTYRSEPDWGPDGIAFWEVSRDENVSRLVVVDPEGTSRRVIVTQPGAFTFGAPRFLAAR